MYYLLTINYRNCNLYKDFATFTETHFTDTKDFTDNVCTIYWQFMYYFYRNCNISRKGI